MSRLEQLQLRKREGPRGQARWFRYTSASSLGIEIAVAIIGSTLAARWVEQHWTGWAPGTTIVGFMIGCGAAIAAIVRTARDYKAWSQAEAKAAEAAKEDPVDASQSSSST